MRKVPPTSPYRQRASLRQPGPPIGQLSAAPTVGGRVRFPCWSSAVLLAVFVGGGVGWGLIGLSSAVLIVLARRARSQARCRAVSSFLDSRPLVFDGLGWATACGLRRVRRGADGGTRLELLDPLRGLTLRSHRIDGALRSVTRSAADGVVVWVAPLCGRAVTPCCFDGLPSELGGHATIRPARFVRMTIGAAGVWLVRCDARGRSLGETAHLSRSAAVRQLRYEYGAHLGRWRRDGRLSLPTSARGWEWGRSDALMGF